MIVIYLKVLQISQGNVANNFTPINHYKVVNLYVIVLILCYNKIAGEWIIREQAGGQDFRGPLRG